MARQMHRFGSLVAIGVVLAAATGCGSSQNAAATKPSVAPQSITPSVDPGAATAHRACNEFNHWRNSPPMGTLQATIQSGNAQLAVTKTLADSAALKSRRWEQLAQDVDLYVSLDSTFERLTGPSQGGVDTLTQMNQTQTSILSDCVGL